MIVQITNNKKTIGITLTLSSVSFSIQTVSTNYESETKIHTIKHIKRDMFTNLFLKESQLHRVEWSKNLS